MTDPFELAFADDLDSAERFQVWLDTLDEREDLVGEYLSLAFATETSPPSDKATRARMWKRLRQLRTAHATEWFGVTPTEDDWRWGIARRLRLDPSLEAIDRCLSSRLGRFVTDFVIAEPLDAEETHAVVQRFATHRCLRGLDLRTFHHDVVFPLGALSLRRLTLRGFTLDDDATVNAGLEALTLKDVSLTAASVHALSRPTSMLRLLSLDGSPALTQQVTTRLAKASHPALKHLSVHVDDAEAVLKHVVASRVLGSLETLEVDGELTEQGLTYVFDHAASFEALETFRLNWANCSHEVVQRVTHRLPRLGRTAQRVVDAFAWID